MNKKEAEIIVENTIKYANEEIKKSKKKYLIISLCCLAVLILMGGVILVLNRPDESYVLVFAHNIEDDIEIKKNGTTKKLIDEEDQQLIYKILSNLGNGKKSDNKYPQNATDIIQIDLIQNNDVSASIYLYIRNNKYYFEYPSTAVFLTTEDIYNKVNEIFLNN